MAVQADLIYMPFMERFALALPEFANFSVTEACGGSIGNWLEAMQQLECCQVAAAEPQLLLKAFRCAAMQVPLEAVISQCLHLHFAAGSL